MNRVGIGELIGEVQWLFDGLLSQEQNREVLDFIVSGGLTTSLVALVGSESDLPWLFKNGFLKPLRDLDAAILVVSAHANPEMYWVFADKLGGD